MPKKKTTKKTTRKVGNLPLGTGTLRKTTDAIKERRRKQAETRKKLGYYE